MSDPLTNMEIQDVLSSIRRLVSEDSRRKPAGDAEPRADAQKHDEAGREASEEPGKLMLTEALRVTEGGETAPLGVDTLRQTIAGDGIFEEGDEVPEIEVRDPQLAGRGQDDVVDWDKDAASDAGEAGSLEDTIAELEAAVAGFGGEFEPDGSEIASDRGVDAELDEVFEDGFAVDQGDDPDVAELSQPVTGGGADDWLEAGKKPTEGSGDAAETDAESGVLVLGESEDRLGGGASDISDQPGSDAVPQDAPVEELPEVVGAAAALPAFSARRQEDSESPEALTAGGTGERATAPPRRLHLGPAEAVAATETVDDGATAEAESAGPDVADAQGTGDSGAEAGESGLSGVAGAEVALEMDVLRELVAEILRDELKGPLGERITRNVRMLVRREIQRALESGENG
ncbi:hypothetical protein DEA8626_03737 [Defluviimonas aquaemixtae]|uniref:Uncharacterized protein n=1 Tax=Albidovulum aquaemixtae TaxID=1542388 RepID=A0A2R8BMM8_9RHOB|nr:hypothetical protein [Defluviimonas aquaemixtae]SPH24701.1 hypothetical protein DEA8626_03737 [Defluviimonas aquaemixtae]